MTATSSNHLLHLAREQRARVERAVHRLPLRDLLATCADFANAHWQLRHCQHVGARTRVRGRLYMRNRGVIHVDEWTLLESTVTPISLLVHAGAVLSIGPHCYLNFGVCVESRGEVRIGPRCHLGQYVHVMDNDQHDPSNHADCPSSRPVVLEEGVWIGAHSVILKGVTIGRGTTVGANSVVTKSLPARCIAAGAPAKVVRYLDEG